MWIKWIDKHGGHVKNERWEKISEGKALDMIRRVRPNGFEQAKSDLFYGGEVRTDNWTITATDPNKSKNQAGTFLTEDPDGAAWTGVLTAKVSCYIDEAGALVAQWLDRRIVMHADGRVEYITVEDKK